MAISSQAFARARKTQKAKKRPPRLERLEDRTLPAVNLISHYTGLNFGLTSGWIRPDPTGAAGPSSYVEVVNQEIAIYTPKATGTSVVIDSLNDGAGGSDFWYTQGHLVPSGPNAGLFNPVIVWDDQVQRFIVAEQDSDFSIHVENLDVAVSKSAAPATLTTTDWYFYQILITPEPGFDADHFGNLGYNHDAFVFTENMYVPTNPSTPDHT